MNELKNTKYMNLLTTIGLFIGFTIIFIYALFSLSYVYLLVGIIVIFIGRFAGYGIDRILDLKEEKEK